MRHHHFDAAGIHLHAVEHGAGNAILFCHGFPAIWSSWRAQMDAVAGAGWRAVALDMRGYGLSGAPAEAEAYTPLHCVGDLVATLDHLGIRQAVVAGHDFGAPVAWYAALLRPDRFRAVFAISVPFRRPGQSSILETMRQAGAGGFYMFAQIRPEADAQWADAAVTIPGMYYWSSGQPPEATRWDLFSPERSLLRPAAEALRGIDPAYVDEAIASFTRTGFHGGLNYYRAIEPFHRATARAFAGATVAQPACFITGARDGLNRVGAVDEATLRQAVPRLTGFHSIEPAGHWPQLETPAAVNAALLAFLARLPAPTATTLT